MGAIVAVAAVKVLVNLAAAGRYGWHRDELYYADAGRHLMLGYSTSRSVTPVLAALARVLFGCTRWSGCGPSPRWPGPG